VLNSGLPRSPLQTGGRWAMFASLCSLGPEVAKTSANANVTSKVAITEIATSIVRLPDRDRAWEGMFERMAAPYLFDWGSFNRQLDRLNGPFASNAGQASFFGRRAEAHEAG
jgi:hypothetical protein